MGTGILEPRILSVLLEELSSSHPTALMTASLLHCCNDPCLKARIIAAVKNIDAPMLTRVWQELEYHIDVCRVRRGAHIEHL
jgi:hypothetical protein